MKQNIMIQGTMSSAGKSLICAALCRIFTQDGFKTAPFKSQNMALNSFITEDAGHAGGSCENQTGCEDEPDSVKTYQ